MPSSWLCKVIVPSLLVPVLYPKNKYDGNLLIPSPRYISSRNALPAATSRQAGTTAGACLTPVAAYSTPPYGELKEI